MIQKSTSLKYEPFTPHPTPTRERDREREWDLVLGEADHGDLGVREAGRRDRVVVHLLVFGVEGLGQGFGGKIQSLGLRVGGVSGVEVFRV